LKTIYCISGLGADERAFSKLKIAAGYNLKVIPWLQPLPAETIEHYAGRMSVAIEEKDPILIGLSFGGIMCTEIAKQVPVQRIILVSSIKTSNELPFWLKAVALLRLHKIIPLRSTRLSAPIQNRMLGVITKQDLETAQHYRKNADINYVKWAVHQVVNWKNNWVHPQIWHIHGDKDNMFPLKYTRPTHTLKGAGHFMIMNRAADVSDCINAILHSA
jgi:pimeloyl-ACP methyl ester carboxylesterase